jgi:hypothetical protein
MRIQAKTTALSVRVRLLPALAVIVLVGCVGRGGGLRGKLRGRHSQPATQSWPMPILAEADVPLPTESAPRGSFAPDAASLPSWSEVNRALGGVPVARPDGYLVLSADDCANRAAEKAPVVELLRLERAAAEEVVGRGYDQGGKLADQVRMLDLRIEQRRDRAAGDALAMLYQLADAESQRAAATEILREIDEMAAAADKIEKVTGNAVPERRDLAIRQTEALDDVAALAAQIELLGGRLRTALRIEAGDERRIWPMVETEVKAESLDVEQAIAYALERRTEIETLRLTDDTLSVDTLSTARTLLAQEDGGLGTVATPEQAIRSSVGKYELGVRRMQLAAALAGTEERIAAEVRAAAVAVETALRHVARAKEVRAQRYEARRLLELEARFDRATRFTLGTANIEALRADAELRHEIVELRQAEIRLLTATGMLLDE